MPRLEDCCDIYSGGLIILLVRKGAAAAAADGVKEVDMVGKVGRRRGPACLSCGTAPARWFLINVRSVTNTD